MALTLVTPPAEEPISLADAKAHLRVEHTDDDALIALYITAARQTVDGKDGWLGRALVTQTWDVSLDAFPSGEIELPLQPLQSVASVTYDDVDGAAQTLDPAGYTFDPTGWIVAGSSGWPATLSAINAVRARFVAGYGAAADVPAPIRAALLLMVGHLYANREAPAEDALKGAAGSLLAPYRIWSL